MSRLKPLKKDNSYVSIKNIDGGHPLKKIPDFYVGYKARKREGARVAFFNFNLAKEMGLIDNNHPNQLNHQLELALIDTFSLVIINEYDIQNKKQFNESEIKPNTYMASRYLQLQHPDKLGLNSGDGRSIWNGQVRHQGRTWDISSCGTGATRLSPATSKYQKFFETGDPSISYGCGYSETDESFASLFFSEVFNKNKLATERVLLVLEFEQDLAICVRANPSLLRPSHLFNHLRQNNYKTLKSLIDYYMECQVENSGWKKTFKNNIQKYQYFLEQQTLIFSQMSARFEDEYIFCWLDWDGDNILMDGGIIDYGSVRQFGLFHHEYRYDDVERYSTNITEQKSKAKYMVQLFAQLVDYLISKEKKNIGHFKKSSALKLFEENFQLHKRRNILFKLGFDQEASNYLLHHHSKLIDRFRKQFTYFERAKSSKGKIEVPDGITWDAIFCMRDILREYPQMMLSRAGLSMTAEEFIEIIRSSYANERDIKLSSYRIKKINNFQRDYFKLVKAAKQGTKKEMQQILLEMSMRSSVINKFDRVTGDSISHIVEAVMNYRPKLSPEELHSLLQHFIIFQHFDPTQKRKILAKPKKENLLRDFYKIVRECREGL